MHIIPRRRPHGTEADAPPGEAAAPSRAGDAPSAEDAPPTETAAPPDGEPAAGDSPPGAADATRAGDAPPTEAAGSDPSDESGVPRWRRASLIAARHADPSQAAAIEHLTFGDGAVAALEGIPFTRVRYRLVELLAEPDETRAAIVGRVDEGDEVQVIEMRGLYRRVRCPDGREGWVHRMTLEDQARAT